MSDNDIPYPTPADRKDLENLVQKNWDNYAVAPYKSWDTDKLTSYLKSKGIETKGTAADNKDSLIAQAQAQWYETEDKAQHAWVDTKDWMLDTWTDSTLKSFADKHGIPGRSTTPFPRWPATSALIDSTVPQPRKRDTLLQQIRSSYGEVAKKAGETAAYPGNWLYETWSESDLKEWLDIHGFPAPQPTSVSSSLNSVHILERAPC